jgi:RNA polymerase sigma-70 factor (ECF subfamily)
LLAAFQRWDRLAGYDRPGAWLRRVVINRAVSARRRHQAERRALELYAGSVEVGRLDPRTEEVWSEVRALPKRQAQVIALFYLEGMTYIEIGALLGCGEATVKTHLRRARETLAERLGGIA